MPTKRVTMRRIKEALRLHLQARLSYDEVGRALKTSKSSAGKYVSLARAAGVNWELAQTLSDDELEARLFRPPVPRSSHQLAPDFALVHQELKRAGVTLQLLWEVMLGFKSFRCASILIAGTETMHMIKKAQLDRPTAQGSTAASQFYSLAF
jgi:hypothetical protein